MNDNIRMLHHRRSEGGVAEIAKNFRTHA